MKNRLVSGFRLPGRGRLSIGVVACAVVVALGSGLSHSSRAATSATAVVSAEQSGNAAEGLRELRDIQAAFIDISNRVEPAVVHIEAEIPASKGGDDQGGDNEGGDDQGNGDAPPFGHNLMPSMPGLPFNFGGPGMKPHTGPGLASGSGVIIDPNGTIITNRHVVKDASRVTVVLTDHRMYRGEVYSDPNIDLAVIKIHPQGTLPYARMADSRSMHIGEWVLAVGYPFDVGESMSRGIISALGRSQTIEGQFYPNLIQTDASINPGNSGGALIDIDGNVIGINTAIAGAAGQSAGIGFAIPASTVNVVWPQLAGPQHRIVNYPKGWIRGKLGVAVRSVTPDLVKVLGVDQGALVSSVQPESPAAKAGIQAGDVVVKVNGVPIRDADELVDAMSNLGPNQDANLSIIRNRQTISRTVVTGSFNSPRTAAAVGQGGTARIGVGVETLTPEAKDELKLPQSVHSGAVVKSVQPGSAADAAGFQQGDVIIQADDTAVQSADDLGHALSGAKPGTSVGVKIYRGDVEQFLVVEIPAR